MIILSIEKIKRLNDQKLDANMKKYKKINIK